MVFCSIYSRYNFGMDICKKIIKKTIKNEHGFTSIKVSQLDDIIIYLVLGIILGGRLGYVIFYNFEYYSQNTLEIFTKRTLSNIIIFVDDDGPGFPEKEHKNVMKPFYRIDKSRGQNKAGVGLGLSIANDIIRSHGGNISLEKSPLNGLRVKISLPL